MTPARGGRRRFAAFYGMVEALARARTLARATPRTNWPFAQGRNNLRAGLSTIAQQAQSQRFDLPLALRNEVKTGKKLL